jgi:hypothetical protein
LNPKKSRPGAYSQVRVEWAEYNHRFFFGHLDPIEIDSDEEMIDVLFKGYEQLPFKAVGRRESKKAPRSKIQVCSKALVTRSGKLTIIHFDFSQFDERTDGEKSWYERRWSPPNSIIGKRQRRKKK